MPNSIGTSGRFLPLKSIAARILCHPLMGRLIGGAWKNKIPHRGKRIETPAGGDPRVNAWLFWGMYESAEIRFVRRYLGNDLDVVELGSSLGGVSCEIAARLGNQKKLVCVEANEHLFPLLKSNVRGNAPGLDVHFALGAVDYSGEEFVDLALGPSNLSSVVGGSAESNILRVPAVTLSGLLATYTIKNYALVCDIEGAEAGLFDRDCQALARCKTIIIELHETTYNGKKYTVQNLIDLLIDNTGLVLRDRYGQVCVFTCREAKTSVQPG